MKLTKQNLRSIIKEEIDIVLGIITENTPDGDGPLGQYVFPTARRDINAEEPDTEEEKFVYNYLIKHYTGGAFKIPNKALSYIVKMIKSNSYPEFFKQHTSGPAYRGMLLSNEDFKKMFGVEPPAREQTSLIQKVKDPAKALRQQRPSLESTVDLQFNFDPRKHPKFNAAETEFDLNHNSSLASSWTTKYKDALIMPNNLGGLSERNTHVAVVLEAESQGNFFIDAKPFAEKMEFFQTRTFTVPVIDELIGVGKIVVTKLHLYDTSFVMAAVSDK